MRYTRLSKNGFVNWSSRTLLLQFSLLISIGITGCKQQSINDYSTSSSEAPSLEATVSPAEQAEAKRLVEQFTHSVDQGNDAAIRKMMTPQLSAKIPELSTWKNGGAYKPLLGAKNWKFNLIRFTGRGKTLVAHTDYLGTDGGTYRTNFAFKKDKENWLLDQLLPPTKPIPPTASEGKMSSQ